METLGWGPVEHWDGRTDIFDFGLTASEALPERGTVLHENPFAPGAPLHGDVAPFGREREVSRLRNAMKSNGSCLVMGPRRSGKTSLLNYIHKSTGGRRVYTVSLQQAGGKLNDPVDLVRVLVPAIADAPDPKLAFEQGLSRDERPLILLDEVGCLARADAGLLTWLRALGQNHAVIVYFGSRRDWTMVLGQADKVGSSFGNDVRTIDLGELEPAVARRFLVETSPADARIPDEPVARWVVERCGGWPFYLQAMGYALVESHHFGYPVRDQAAFTELYRNELLRGWDGVFASHWDDIPPVAQRILAREIERLRERKQATLPAYRELGADERAYLESVGLLDFERGWLLDRPFQDWLRERSTLRVPDSEDDEQ